MMSVRGNLSLLQLIFLAELHYLKDLVILLLSTTFASLYQFLILKPPYLGKKQFLILYFSFN